MAYYTNEEIRKARQTDLPSYLHRENEMARKAGNVEPYKLEIDGNQIRVAGYGGLMVTGNMWNQRSTNKGGNALDFLQEIEKRSFKESIQRLLNQEHGYERITTSQREQRPKVPFELPERNETFKRVIAYLTKTRGLDAEIVLKEIKAGNLYEDKQYHNAVFVGKDQNNEPKWAQKRSTLSDHKMIYDQTGSDARFPFFYGNKHSNTVIVTESPIEALSYASLIKMHGNDPEKTAILPLGGVHDTALQQYLRDNPHVKNIVTALNNDRATKPDEIKGREASELIQKKYEGKGIYVKQVFPKGKDWNDDLRSLRIQEIEKKPVLVLTEEQRLEKQIKDYAKKKELQKQQQKGPMLNRTRSR